MTKSKGTSYFSGDLWSKGCGSLPDENEVPVSPHPHEHGVRTNFRCYSK
jgi:hypothetical protein